MLLRRMFVVVRDQNIQMQVLCQGKGWWGLVSGIKVCMRVRVGCGFYMLSDQFSLQTHDHIQHTFTRTQTAAHTSAEIRTYKRPNGSK